jgi:hypothetical protein
VALTQALVRRGAPGIDLAATLGPGGEVAPFTPRGATSWRPEVVARARARAEAAGLPRPTLAEIREGATARQQEQLDAWRNGRRKRWRRIGALFRHLLSEGRRANVWAAGEGADLTALADAVGAWADARLKTGTADDPALSQRLGVELMALLAAYNGRSLGR